VPYETWEREGYIETTPGAATNYKYVVRSLADIAARYDVRAIAFDRWRIEDLRREMDAEGIEIPMVEFIQGFKSFSPAIDELERLVADGRLVHDGNPVLNWNIGNTVIETDAAGNRKPTKVRSREKIDGLVALVMALGIAKRCAGAGDVQLISPWEDPDAVVRIL